MAQGPRTGAIQMLCGGAVLLVAGMLAGEPADVRLARVSAGSAWAFAFLVVSGSIVTYTAYVWLLAHAPLGRVATYAVVNPVVAVALGAALLGEAVTTNVVAGAAVVIAAVALVVRRDRGG